MSALHPRLLSILALVLLARPATAAEPGTWAHHPHRADLGALLAEHRVEVAFEPDAAALVDAAWVEDVRWALSALPAAARAFPGGPLTLEQRAAERPLGMGDGAASAPEWAQGRRRFLLYRYQDQACDRAAFRLERLSPLERARLWRRRAVVHAVIQRWDDHLGWSRSRRWRDLTGWSAPLESLWPPWAHRANPYPGAYSRARGMASASLDLVTFAEEALVPAQAMRADALAPDDAVHCQEFSKLRFLEERLGVSLREGGGCPAFEAWAEEAELSHLELLFSAPSSVRPESSFGHLMLRAVPTEGTRVRGPSSLQALEVAALTGGEPPLSFVFRGVTGGFQNVFSLTPLSVVLGQNLELDQRSLRRFRLKLQPHEQTRVLERVWELERRGYFPYYFFTRNCASFIIHLLNGAVDGHRRIEVPGPGPVLPTAVLDAIAAARTEEGGPLLVPEPGRFRPSRERAVEAERRAQALVDALTRSVDPALAAQWRQLLQGAQKPRVEARADAYGALLPLAALTLEGAPAEAAALMYGIVDALVEVEQYAVHRARRAAMLVEHGLLLPSPALARPPSEALLHQRQRLFERERPDERYLAERERVTRTSELLEDAPRRAATPAEQAVLEEGRTTLRVFARLTALQADLVDAHLGEVPAAYRHARVERTQAEREAAQEARSLPGSGFRRVSFWAGGGTTSGRTVHPVVRLRTAFLAERLGEQRSRGLRAGTGLVLLDSSMELGLRDRAPAVGRLDLEVARLRSMPQEPQLARARLHQRLGVGAGFSLHRRPDESLPYRGLVHAEGYGVLHAAEAFRGFTLLGLGAAAQVRGTLLPEAALVGPRLELSHRTHLFGRYANALVLEASWMPLWKGIGPATREVVQQGAAGAAVELALGAGGLVVSPRVDLDWDSGRPRPLRVLAGVGVDLP